MDAGAHRGRLLAAAPGLSIPGCVLVAVVLALSVPSAALARNSGDPVRLQWVEGDISGFQSISSADGQHIIGFVEYTQSRRGDVLKMVRVSRFNDGSSDEDWAEADVGSTLKAVSGRSIIRDKSGRPIVDLDIDVTHGRITGFTEIDHKRETFDEAVDLPPGTYWGPLLFVVLKNFDANAENGRLVFRTVAPTPSPRVLDMEIVRKEVAHLSRPGGTVDAVHFAMHPTVNSLVDPLIRMIAPDVSFFIAPTSPPSLARFTGPRNYEGEGIRLE